MALNRPPQQLLPRRALFKAGAVAGLALLAVGLPGCGFHLRVPADLPYSRIALARFVNRSPMAEALRRSLPASVTVVDAPHDAQIVVVALDDRFTKTVVASTAVGQVREFRLRVALKFRLTRPDGEPLTADTELEQSRDLSYTETQALGKEAEEAVLVREMRNDIAQQLLQMVSAVGRGGIR
jgi:LPS-assembly lipoprotein